MNVREGDEIPIRVRWTLNGAPASGAVARAHRLNAGIQEWWDGAQFAPVQANLGGLEFADGELSGVFVVPAEAVGYVLTLEAIPTGPASLVEERVSAEYRVLAATEDDVLSALQEIDADVGEAGDAADDDGSLHAKLRAVAGRQKAGRIEFRE